MAKKKLAPTNEKQAEQDLPQQPQQDPPIAPQPTLPSSTAMEDSEAKLSKLKSLNDMLLKETTEKRKEVSSLLESKKSLETELTRSASEIELLKSELARIKEGEVGIEVEKGVVSAFVESQVGDATKVAGELELLKREVESLEQKNETMRERNERLVKERDDIHRRVEDLKNEKQGALRQREETEKVKSEEITSLKKLMNEMRDEIEKLRNELNRASCEGEALERQYKSQFEDTVKLREKLSVVEAEEKKKDEELRELKLEYNNDVKVRNEMQILIESMKGDRKAMEKSLVESNARIQKLERDTLVFEQEKADVEKEKNEMRCQIAYLVKESSELNNVILCMRKDEEEHRSKFLELENAYTQALVKQNQLNRDLTALFEENKKKENIIEKLMDENSKALERSVELEKDLKTEKEVNQTLMLEKDEIQQEKAHMGSDILNLQKESTMLRDKLSSLEDSYNNQADKNKQLVTEIAHYKSEVDRVNHEKNGFQKSLAEEKNNGKKLNVKIADFIKKMEDDIKQIESLKAANDKLVEEKKELEKNIKKVVNEKGMQDKKYLEAQRQIVVLEGTVKSKSDTLEQALLMLKKAAEQLTQATKEGGVNQIQVNERQLNGDSESYMGQLEAIRVAFANRELKVEEMKQQVDSLQISVKEAQKRKSFWTLVSSATTILAAVVSFAYASKLR